MKTRRPIPTLAVIAVFLALDGILLHLAQRPPDCTAGGGDPALGLLLLCLWTAGPIVAVVAVAGRDARLGRASGPALAALAVAGAVLIVFMHAAVLLVSLSQSLSCGFF